MKQYNVIFHVQNEVGVLARLTIKLRKYSVNIQAMEVHAKKGDEHFSDMHMTLETKGNIDLILKKIETIVPVIGITRE